MSAIAKTIGERLRRKRQELGYSQELTAEKAELHPTYIGQVERGEKNATLESIEKICIALNYPLENLFEKIIISSEEQKIPAQCFHLILTQPRKEQEKLLYLLEQLIEYKNL